MDVTWGYRSTWAGVRTPQHSFSDAGVHSEPPWVRGGPALASYSPPRAPHYLTGLWLVPAAERKWTSVWQSLGGDLFIAQGGPASGTAPPVGPSRVLISHLLQHRPCTQGAPGRVWAGWGDGRGGERSISPGYHGPDRAQRLGTGQKRHQESCDGWAAEVSSSYDGGQTRQRAWQG